MYRIIEGTAVNGYAKAYGITGSGAHEEVIVPIKDGMPVDTTGIPLESDDRLILLGDTKCESFLGGGLLVVVDEQ